MKYLFGGKNARAASVWLAAAVFSGVLLFGYGCDNGGGGGKTPNGPDRPSETPNALALSSGEAWIYVDTASKGCVFLRRTSAFGR